MVIAQKYWTKKNITNLGFEREDTKIGGSGTYGTDIHAGRVVWPDDVQDITITMARGKSAEPRLGNTWERTIRTTDVEKVTMDISGFLVDEYEGYGSLLGYVLGSDPLGAKSETASTTTTGQGTITPQDQLGSFTAEVGHTDGTNDEAYLFTGCVPTKLSLEMEQAKPITRTVSLLAQKATGPSSSFVSCTGDDVTDLTEPTARRAQWSDITFTWSDSLTPELRKLTIDIDRAVQRNDQLGTSEYMSTPIPTGYLVTGTLDALKEAGDSTLMDIARAGPGTVAGTNYIDSLEVVIDNGSAHIDITLDDIMLLYNGSYRLTKGRDIEVESYSFNAIAQISSAVVHG